MRRRADALMVRFLVAGAPAAAGAGREAEFPEIWLRSSDIFCSTWSRLSWKPIRAASSNSVSCLAVCGIRLLYPYLSGVVSNLWVTPSNPNLFGLARTGYNTKVDRRSFLGMVAPVAIRHKLAGAVSIPIVDTHIHLFDTARPQGVPWPDKADAMLYRPALPRRYRKVTEGLGIVAAIEIECSPWLEDNQWVLDVAAPDPIVVGTIGNLEPGHPKFRVQLERFMRNPLFRGIRYGNLWGRDLGAEIPKPEFIGGIQALAEAGLSLDTANPTPELITAVIRLTDRVPNLRVILDHLPQLDPATANLRELAQRPQIYVKVSGVLRRVSGRVPLDTDFYRSRLDAIWDIFGQDRLLYGSDWPNSDPLGTYAQVLTIVEDYFHAKGTAVAEKYFWKNSIAAYGWIKRDARQPGLA